MMLPLVVIQCNKCKEKAITGTLCIMEVGLSSRTSLQISAPIVLEHVEMICEYIEISM